MPKAQGCTICRTNSSSVLSDGASEHFSDDVTANSSLQAAAEWPELKPKANDESTIREVCMTSQKEVFESGSLTSSRSTDGFENNCPEIKET